MTALRGPCLGRVAFLLLVLAVDFSSQHQTSVVNQGLSVSSNEETVNIGNEQTNNYHLEEKNYQPTQNTHVTVNLGKTKSRDPSKMRASRPPTVEEMAVKQRILEIYEHAEAEALSSATGNRFLHLKHLGRVLRALNPKYVATKRVWLEAFADLANPGAEVVPPEREIFAKANDAPAFQPLELSADEGRPPIGDQLDQLASKFQNTVNWDKRFVQKLFELPDSKVTPSQLAFKQLLQCLTYPLFCNKIAGRRQNNFEPNAEESGHKQPETSAIERGALKERLIRMPPHLQRLPAGEFVPQPDVGQPSEVPLSKSQKLVRQLGIRLPPLAEPSEKEESREVDSELEQEQYGQPQPVRQMPMGRRRFAPEPHGPPQSAAYNPQRYPPRATPYGGYQGNARLPPRGLPLRRSPPPRQQPTNEFTQRLIQKYAPDYESRRLG